jgi:hypothetical protein
LASIARVGSVFEKGEPQHILRFDCQAFIETSIGPHLTVGEVTAKHFNAFETVTATGRRAEPRRGDGGEIGKLAVDGALTVVGGEVGMLGGEEAEVFRGGNGLIKVVVMAMAIIDEGKDRGSRMESGREHQRAVETMAEEASAISTPHAATVARGDGFPTDVEKTFRGRGAEIGRPGVEETYGRKEIAVGAGADAGGHLLTAEHVEGTLKVGGRG